MSDEIGIAPEGSNCVVEVIELDDVSPGGIHIPAEAKDHYRQICTIGNLVSIGPATQLAFKRGGKAVQVTDDELPLRVTFSQYGGTPLRIRSGREVKNYRLLTEGDVTSFLFDEIEAPREV